MSGERIWIWLEENTWLAAGILTVLAILAMVLRWRTIGSVLLMLTGLLLMARAEADRRNEPKG